MKGKWTYQIKRLTVMDWRGANGEVSSGSVLVHIDRGFDSEEQAVAYLDKFHSQDYSCFVILKVYIPTA